MVTSTTTTTEVVVAFASSSSNRTRRRSSLKASTSNLFSLSLYMCVFVCFSLSSVAVVRSTKLQIWIHRRLHHIWTLRLSVAETLADELLCFAAQRRFLWEVDFLRVSNRSGLQNLLLRLFVTKGTFAVYHLVENNADGPDVDFTGDFRRRRAGLEAFRR